MGSKPRVGCVGGVNVPCCSRKTGYLRFREGVAHYRQATATAATDHLSYEPVRAPPRTWTPLRCAP